MYKYRYFVSLNYEEGDVVVRYNYITCGQATQTNQ